MSITPARIAVVGASVRGTSLVERLIASAAEVLGSRPLQVTVFDPHPPGSGRIWRGGQPPSLIMNTVAAQSTLFTDDTVRIAGPVVPGPTLAEWCRLVTADPAQAALPSEVAAEAARTQAASSPSRLLYGHYLRWCFARIVDAAPDRVRVDVVPAAVTSAARGGAGETGAGGNGWTLTAGGASYEVDAVVLAVGWLPRAGAAPHPRIVAPGNPIDQDVTAIAPGETVAVRGVGMGFFDVVSMLTEGRGGRFLADDTVYEASGREPVLLAGSSRGIPYRAKPAFGAPPFFPAQRVLRAALPALHARRPVDFAADVLPLIERDALHDYYEALARVRPAAVRDASALLAGLVTGAEDVAALIAAHVADPGLRLSLADAAAPPAAWSGRAGQRTDGVEPDAAEIDAVVAEIVRADAVEAALGMDSPLKLGLHSYAAARGAVIDLVAFGGLTPESFPAYRRFLAVAASFGSGPPLLRSRQLLALHAAGVVRFVGPGMQAAVDDEGVTVESDVLPAPVRADRLVEAWLPGPSVDRTADPLLRGLVAQGLARAWPHAPGIPSDALDVRAEDGAVRGADGEVVPGLFSVGVPHEDIRVFTIIAPVPGTNSSVLRETDAAARAALAYARGSGATEQGEAGR